MNITPVVEQAVDARLRAIADELFGPSRDTLAAVALGGEKILAELPLSMQQRLQAPPFDRTIEIIRNMLADGECYVQHPFFDPPARGTAPMERGQIRVVEGVDLNEPSAARRYTESVLVLLDRPVRPRAEEAPTADIVWQAWTVSAHTGFAGYWDLLLQGDDIPVSCGMVQAWNLVRVTEAQLGRCRYELDAEQQAMVDALWLEYLSGTTEPNLEGSKFPRWRTVGLRLTAQGAEVVTGSAIFGADDPRHMFQRLYARVRESLAAAMPARKSAGEITDMDKAKLAAVLIYSSLIERVKFTGLSDGSQSVSSELLAPGASRYVADKSPTEQAKSVWIEWASYSSTKRKLALAHLKKLPADSVQYEFYVAFPLRDDKGRKLKEEERIKLDNQIVEERDSAGKRRIAFLFSTRQLVAERILAGPIDFEIEVRSDGGSKYLAEITIREG